MAREITGEFAVDAVDRLNSLTEMLGKSVMDGTMAEKHTLVRNCK